MGKLIDTVDISELIPRVIWINVFSGGMAEWSKAAVLKTAVPSGTGGSNPSSSAKIKRSLYGAVFILMYERFWTWIKGKNR